MEEKRRHTDSFFSAAESPDSQGGGHGGSGSGAEGSGPSHDPDVEALLRDIRDRVVARKQETKRHRERPASRDLAAAASDLLFVVDLEGKIDYLNPAAAGFLGVAPEELLGQPFEKLDLLPPPEEAEELLARVIALEEIVTYEKPARTGSETRHLYTTLSPMKDADGMIDGVLGIAKDVSDLARSRDALRALSMFDELTGIYNRRGFSSLATQHLSLAQRNGTRLCLAMADMDGLKAINDTFGHLEGDQALIAFAGILKANCRKSDVVARIGGDEFALLAVEVAEGGADFLVARLRKAVRTQDALNEKPYHLSASIGAVECLPGPSYTLEDLLADADRKVYEVKRARAS